MIIYVQLYIHACMFINIHVDWWWNRWRMVQTDEQWWRMIAGCCIAVPYMFVSVGMFCVQFCSCPTYGRGATKCPATADFGWLASWKPNTKSAFAIISTCGYEKKSRTEPPSLMLSHPNMRRVGLNSSILVNSFSNKHPFGGGGYISSVTKTQWTIVKS